MKVAILFFNFGGGHIEAARNVRAALEAAEPDVEVRLFDGLELAPDIVEGFFKWMWNRVQSKNQGIWDFMYTWRFFSSAFWGYWMNWWMWWGLRAAVAAYDPDAVLSTHFICPPLAKKLKQKKKLRYTISHFLTEFVWHEHYDWHPGIDRYFVCSEQNRERLVAHGFDDEHVALTGIPIKAVFAERIAQEDAKRALAIETEKRVVFFFAGTFGGTSLERVLVEMKARDVFPLVVCGKNEAVKARLESLFASEGIEGKVYGFVTNMNVIMSASDFMVGKGGALSCSECLALGVPIILFGSPPGNEAGNAEFMEKIGAGIVAGGVDDVMKHVDDFIAHPERVKAMRDAGLRHGFPCAAKDAAEIVLRDHAALLDERKQEQLAS